MHSVGFEPTWTVSPFELKSNPLNLTRAWSLAVSIYFTLQFVWPFQLQMSRLSKSQESKKYKSKRLYLLFLAKLTYNAFHLKCHNSLNGKKVKAQARKVSFRIKPGEFCEKQQKKASCFPSFLIFVILTIVTF